jgi:hypothetical protein
LLLMHFTVFQWTIQLKLLQEKTHCTIEVKANYFFHLNEELIYRYILS